MQASAYTSVKGSIGFGVQNQGRVLLGLGESRNRGVSGFRNLCMTDRGNCCGGLSLSLVAMGTELVRTRFGVDGIFGSSAKSRSLRAQASGRNINQVSLQVPSATSTVLQSYEISTSSGTI